ncbi:MAG: SDR family NAD(P)-dependent oxidoreductase [Myxococcota bacterium]
MREWLRHVLSGRPGWMNALMIFSAYMAIVYVPWDFFMKPVALDEEVWFGVRLHGWAAKLTEPLHWAIYAAGAYGFLRMKEWMWPWAAIYVGQVAISMLVWPLLYVDGVGGVLFGAVAFVPFALLTRALWNARERFASPATTLRERYGEWALVTGASAGIGAEFARALARDGVSVVLVARRADRLEALAAELEKTWSVQTRSVACDLATPEGIDAVAAAVADLPLAILVNNAGFGYSGRFDKLDEERLRQMVELNCVAPTVLTRRLLPALLERARGGAARSAVVITGSVAGRQPLPLHGVYSATKAFDLLLGESLFVELREHGVDVVVLEPGSTATEFQEVAGEIAHEGEPPQDVVRVALEALGRQPSVVSGWFNWLRANLAGRLAPRPFVAYLARDVMEKQTPEEMR